MKKLCQPNDDGVCTQCFHPVPKNHYRPCLGPDQPPVKTGIIEESKPVPARPKCASLGEPTSEVDLIKCETCKGNVRIKFAVHECAVFGTCLPTYPGPDQSRARCQGCPSYEIKVDT